MLVAQISATTPADCKERIPDSGFVRIVSVGPIDKGLGDRLRSIQPHIVVIDSPCEDELRVVRTAIRSIRAGADGYPLPLLVTGAGHHSTDWEHVDPEPAGDDSNIVRRAVNSFAARCSPRLLWLDDNSSLLPEAPYEARVWNLPLHFEQGWFEKETGDLPASWALPSRRPALGQLLLLAEDWRRPAHVLLDIHLHDARVAVGVATALLHATGALIQPVSGFKQQPAFTSKAPWLAQLFPGRLRPSRSRDDLSGLDAAELRMFIEDNDATWFPGPPTSAPRTARLDDQAARLATLAWFEWNIPWEPLGLSGTGRWGFARRTTSVTRPAEGYRWEAALLKGRQLPTGWLDSGDPRLLETAERGFLVIPERYLVNAKRPVLATVTACLGALPEDASIRALARLPGARDWVDWNHRHSRGRTRDLKSLMEWAHPLDTLLSRLLLHETKRPLELLGYETAATVQATVYAAAPLFGLRPHAFHDDMKLHDTLVYAILGVVEHFRREQAGAKRKQRNRVARQLLHLMDQLSLRKPRAVEHATLRSITDASELDKTELTALSNQGERHVQLLVLWTLAG